MSEIGREIQADKALVAAIPGTYLFDGPQSRRGYALSKMCASLAHHDNRAAFSADQRGYCRRYGLDGRITELVLARDWLGMIRAGGNIYYLFKLAAVDHLSMQRMGAQQNGMTIEDFRAKLNSFQDC